MPILTYRLRPNLYRESTILRQIVSDLQARPGVLRATAAMATPANLARVAAAGLLPTGLACSPDDLLIVLEAEGEPVARAALDWAESELARPRPLDGEATDHAVSAGSVVEARARLAGASVAIITGVGSEAAAAAASALRAGMHVALAASGVSLADETTLKCLAAERGLLLLGPDFGGAILGGVPIGTANVVRSGPIGLLADSGTGMQELACLVHRWGSGISHAISVGRRDCSGAVGGMAMLAGLRLLLDDPATRAVVLLTTSATPAVASRIGAAAARAARPVVLAMLGATPAELEAAGPGAARTLEQAARSALEAIGLRAPALPPCPRPLVAPPRRFVRGLFVGATLCAEAALVIGERIGPVVGPVATTTPPEAHSCFDLGDEPFRAERLAQAARDPQTAVVLFDMLLGVGTPADQVGPLLAAIEPIEPGERPPLVAHVCGTDDDPQPRAVQVDRLRAAGVIVAETNAQAARIAASIVRR